MTNNSIALENIRVLDLSRVLAGPYCTMLLADYGAEVIKVEQPGRGDGTRQWGPPWIGDQSAYFLSVNRNKHSLALNLKHEEGRTILRRLLADADILIENFKPGTMAKWGLDYEALAADFPGLIYCAITGYGQTGPYRDRPGYDFAIQAEGGLMSITGPADGGPADSGPANGGPHKVGVAVADITTGLYATIAILTALHHREHTGKGQYIDVALLDAQVGWLANVAHNYFATGQTPGRYGNAHPNIVPYELFATQDGQLALAIGNDAQYRRFCALAGRDDLAADERFQTNAGRVQHRTELVPLFQDLLRTRTTADWLAICAAENIPAGPLNDIPTILNDAHIQARDMVQTVEHPTLGPIQQLGPVAKLSATPAAIRTAPPLLGADTVAILQEKLEMSTEEIGRLRIADVVG
jgi:crotonobetainyl-CoA:carnitine CoA-transferase CaiB-like acyl-CoA transferase